MGPGSLTALEGAFWAGEWCSFTTRKMAEDTVWGHSDRRAGLPQGLLDSQALTAQNLSLALLFAPNVLHRKIFDGNPGERGEGRETLVSDSAWREPGPGGRATSCHRCAEPGTLCE